jgi:hypothetical protein
LQLVLQVREEESQVLLQQVLVFQPQVQEVELRELQLVLLVLAQKLQHRQQ